MRQIAEDVLRERYYQPGETCWDDVSLRVANYIGNDEVTREEYYQAIAGLELIPNSPALMNAGTSNPQMSACFCVPVGDSKEEIFDAVKFAAVIHSSGGGTGFNFSSIRAKGSPVGGTGKIASGPISFMKVFNAATETIKQGGKRRGANLGSLDVHHPDIKEFITCKSKEGELSNFNISVIIDDEFMNNPEPEILDLIVDGKWKNGEPGILFKEAREKDNKRPELGKLDGTNPCITGDSLILTNCGYKRIADLIGKQTVIWNGYDWSVVVPYKTSDCSEVWEVKFSNGASIKCTPYHKFAIWKGNSRDGKETRKQLCDCKVGDLISKFEYPLIQGERTLQDAYTMGFLSGDGYYNIKRDVHVISLYHKKRSLVNLFTNVYNIIEMDRRIDLYLKKTGTHWNKDFVPSAEYTINGRLDWLSGVIDSDGCKNCNGGSISISSIKYEFLDAIRLMLSTLGVYSTIGVMKEESVKSMPNGNGGHSNYYCKKSFRIVISQSNVKKLICLGLNLHRVDVSDLSGDRDAQRFIRITEINQPDEWEPVYCLTEPKNHTMVVDGVICGQCGETALFPWESCNLASINLMSCYNGEFDWDKFNSLVRLGVRFLNDMIDKNMYPLPQIEEATKLTRKIGLGVMGFADLLIALGMRYGDQDSLDFADKLFRDMREVADDESQSIGGNNAALLSIAPTGSISLFAGVSSGIEPNFGYVYNRSTWASGEKTTYREVHPMFEDYLTTHHITYTNDILEYASKNGTLKGCPNMNGHIIPIFCTAKDISPMDHVRMQAVIQKHVDQAISKSINCAYETTKEEISDLIKFAWESGCKGLTIYREGSRSDVVLETNATKKVEEKKPDKKEPVTIPREIDLKSIRMNSACGILWVKTGFLHGCSDPIEVWVDAEKGGCRANLEFIGRLVSKMLQEGINYEVACKQGDKVFCSACVNNVKNESEGYSCANLISKGIKEGIKKREEDLKTTNRIDDITYADRILSDWGEEKCPECGAKLNRIEGCFTCSSCGFSRCK